MTKATSKLEKLTLLLISSLTIMSVITISPALPEMQAAFIENENASFLVKLVLTIPALFIALTSIITGILIDRYGRLPFLRLALLLYAVAGTAGYWLIDIYHILISRALLGVAVGISMTIVITLVADYYKGQERQKFIGIQVAFMSLGGILFIGLGGVLADIGWHFPFLLYLFSLVVFPFSLMYLHEPKTVVRDENEAVGKSPGIIWLLFVNVFVLWIFFFLIPVQVPFHLKDIGIEKNALIGIAIALSTAFSAISSFSYSKLKNRLSFTSIFTLGYLLLAMAFLVLSYSHTYLLVVIAMMLAGLGMGMMIPNTNMWIMKIAPPTIRGKEIGRLTTFWFMGQFLSPIVLLPLASTMTLPSLFMMTSIILLIIAVFFFVLKVVIGEQ